MEGRKPIPWTVIFHVEGQRVPDFYDVEAPTCTAALAVVIERREEDMQNPPTVEALYVVPMNPLARHDTVEEAREASSWWDRFLGALPWTGPREEEMRTDSEGRPESVRDSLEVIE